MAREGPNRYQIGVELICIWANQISFPLLSFCFVLLYHLRIYWLCYYPSLFLQQAVVGPFRWLLCRVVLPVWYWFNRSLVISYKEATTSQGRACLVDKCYHWHHRIKQKLASNKQHPHLCPVENWLDINNRFLPFLGPTVKVQPLVIYKWLKKIMQFIVRTINDITDECKFKQITNHSL